ncbi:ribonuclease H-like domain-containing protein [Tanacetum coccineum]
MSQPANDEFSQHLIDDEASNHEDTSDTGVAPKQQQQHVIQNGNSKKRISTGKDGVIRILPPVTAAEIQAVEKERKAKNILLMAIPKEHMRRFHGMDDAKEIWEAIKTRFGGNANSKKMQKALEAHGAEVSTEDANYKFLRSLPPAWSNLAMTMRTKPDVDTLSIDDLYNNLRVFEQEIQGASKTSSSAQNVAFVSQSKSNTNKVKSSFTGAYSTCTPSTSSTNVPEKEVLAGFADEVIYSLFAKQSEDWDLLHEDLEQIDDLDIEEMDINWQIAMIAIRMKKFYKKTGRRVRVDGKTPVGFDKKKLECFNCHNTGHFARECTAKGTHDGKKRRDSFYQHQEAGKQEKNQMGLLTMDDGIVNWGEHTKDEETNHALMAISSSSEANEIYEKDEKLKRYRRIGMKAVKEKEQLQKTLDSWKDSSKNLWRLINSGMRPQDPEPNVSDDRSSEYSTCQSNDSAGSIETSSEHSVDPESEILSVPLKVYMSTPKTTNEKGVSIQNQKRTNVNPVRPRVNIGSSNVNTVRSRQPVPNKTSNNFSPKRPQGSAVKTSAGYNWRNSNPNSNCDSGPTFIRTDHPLKNMVDRGIFDSRCSGHMTGNKDQLEDFEEFNGGSVTFGGSKGYISDTLHLNVVKRIFKYLKGKPHLGLWYPRESPFDLEAFSNSDYGGSNLDRKSTTGFAEIVDFLRGSNLRYALTTNPTIYDSLVKQFWQTATANTLADGTLELHATIDTTEYTITEASIRDKLQLADASGITMLPNNEIFEGMGHMGYPTDGSFTFWKSFFTPQWRFLVHHLLHCISSKSGGWDQLGSNIATALICLSTGIVYNFSKLIFDGMVANLKSKTKFLIYSRFLQLILDIQTENKHPYLAVTLTKTIFGNMKRGFRGVPIPLFPAMLLVATTNPSVGQEHPDVAQSQPSSSTILVPSTSLPPEQSPPPITTPIPASTPTPIPETDPEPMEHTFKEPSPAHQYFSPPQEHDQGHMTLDNLLQLVKKVKKIEDIEQRKKNKRRKETKGKKVVTSLDFQEEVSIGYAKRVNTAEGVTTSSQGKENSMIIEEAPKKTKEQILQEEASLAEAIRLDTLEKEEEAKQHYTDEDWDLIRAKIEANAELSKKERERAKRNKPMTQSQLRTYMMNYLKNQGTWKLSQLKNLIFEEVKEEFDKLVKQVESFAPINFEATKDSLKRFGEEIQTKTSKRLKSDEAKDDESTKKTGKRRKQIARKGLHYEKTDEDESEASKDADPISGTNIPVNLVLVAIKPPSIATYKIIKQGKEGVYQIVREDRIDIVYINFGAMLKDITRDDLTELYRIVMNRYGMNGTRNDHRRVHCLNLESSDVYMLTERKYPLTAEVCKAMLDKKLQGGKPDEDCYKLLKWMEKQAGIRK